jgi:hypothetical protein
MLDFAGGDLVGVEEEAGGRSCRAVVEVAVE